MIDDAQCSNLTLPVFRVFKESLRKSLFKSKQWLVPNKLLVNPPAAKPQKATRDRPRANPRGDWRKIKILQIPPGYRRVEKSRAKSPDCSSKVAVPKIVREIAQDFKTDLRFQSSAVLACKRRSVLGWLVRRHQLVRDPRQESHHHPKDVQLRRSEANV